jgi:hypothetical protein
MSPANIFDDLPALQDQTLENRGLHDELERFLSTERELGVKNGLVWWFERKHIYPRLYRMAMDYLSIPGKFIYARNCTHSQQISQPPQ